jgi:predicted nucleic acid-binding protein
MAALLDTSVVVRYLTRDHPTLSPVSRRIIEEETDLYLSAVVIAETAYTLMSQYDFPREVVVDHLAELIRRENVQTLHIPKPLAIQALLLCRPSGRVSFADAMTWAEARAARVPVIYSFDDRFPRDGIEVRSAAHG